MNEIDNINQDVISNREDLISLKSAKNKIEEMKILEQQIKDPNVKTFKKSINWKQQSLNNMNKNQEVLLKEISERLLRIESKVDALLKK